MNPKIKHFLLLALFTLLAAPLVALPPRLWAQSPNQAALVIRYGDGQVATHCVTFTEPQITGYDVLVRAGLDVTIDAGGMGAAVCAIQGTGCPATNCFCQCQGAECQYWSYWHQVDGIWQYSPGGASIYPVTHGAIEGWSWGPGSVTEAIAPPAVSFDAVCNAPAATATAAPPTPTLLPPTPTPSPQVNFWAEAALVNAGSCTVLHWQVDYVTAAYLDGAGVEGVGARQICPAQTQTYTLRVTHPGGELQRQVSIAVQPLPTATLPAATATPAPPLPTSSSTRLPAATASPATATAAAATAVVPSPIVATTGPFASSPLPPTVAPTAVIAFAISTATTAVTAPTAVVTVSAVAALSPVPLPTPLPAAAPSPAAAAATAGSWLNYAIFGLICLGLGGALALRSRRRVS